MTKVALRKTGSLRPQKPNPIAAPAASSTPSPNMASLHASTQRRAHFDAYVRDSGITVDQLASTLLLSPGRMQELLTGHASITDELATHIEEMLQLPASWLDEGGHLPNEAAPSSATVKHATNGGATMQPLPVADKRRIDDNRRSNLNMLTTERGSKSRLALLAGTSGSRISLMTSARKPVSDPFAFAIEDGLGLPRGWLDQPRAAASVPASAWQRLQPETATPALPRTRHDGVATLAAPGFGTAETPSVNAATAPAVNGAPRPGRVKAGASATGLFDKPAGLCGPIAEALAKTILNLSASDKLSEARAFQLLGALIAETEPEV